MADRDAGEIFHEQGLHRTRELERQARNLFRSLRPRQATQNELLVALIDKPAAGVRRVLLDDFGELAKSQVGLAQLRRIGLNDNLPFVTTARIHFGHAGHSAQLRLHHEFLDLRQF